MMKYWTTIIKAEPWDKPGPYFCFAGPLIAAETMEEAQKYCEENGLGYCKVDAEYVGEINSTGTDLF
ncbi:MAG TPA: hypothetical protein VMU29_12140 [Smithella sp.]|nr:hypothetical protein [Smithella sp.]